MSNFFVVFFRMYSKKTVKTKNNCQYEEIKQWYPMVGVANSTSNTGMVHWFPDRPSGQYSERKLNETTYYDGKNFRERLPKASILQDV